MRTKEPQYQRCLDVADEHGLERLGLMFNQMWQDNPVRVLFGLARYKFVSKMLEGCDSALEIGCADGFGTRLVRQVVPHVVGIDFDSVFIQDALHRQNGQWDVQYHVHDVLTMPFRAGTFDAMYALDVLEHIPPAQEDVFLRNAVQSLNWHGVALIGMPSKESQVYASAISTAGHVNCKTGTELRQYMQQYFHNVFVFSMNDEVIHTGYYAMAHYLIALCTSMKNRAV